MVMPRSNQKHSSHKMSHIVTVEQLIDWTGVSHFQGASEKEDQTDKQCQVVCDSYSVCMCSWERKE